MLAAVLERFAEREAEVVVVGLLQVGLRLVLAHALQFEVRETVGLHVGEAPIGLTEVRARFDGAMVGGDGSGRVALGLQGVPQRLVEFAVARHLLEQPSVTLDGAVDIAERQQDAGIGDPHALVAGFRGHQPLALLARPRMLLQVDEGEHEVVAGSVVVGSLGEHLLQILLGVDVVLEVAGDPGEHPQPLDIVGIRREEGVDGALGVLEIPVREHGARRDDGLRQLGERRHMVRRVGLLALAVGDPVELLQGLPARGQGRVDAYRGFEGVDGLRRVARHHMAVAALLEEARVARMEGLQRGERAERLGDAVQHALRHRRDVQQVAMAAVLGEVGLGDLQHLDIAAAREGGAQHRERGVERRDVRGGRVLRLQRGSFGQKKAAGRSRPAAAVDRVSPRNGSRTGYRWCADGPGSRSRRTACWSRTPWCRGSWRSRPRSQPSSCPSPRRPRG